MAGGTVHGGSSARFPTKPTEKLKIEKMYAIKQIKICEEYRDMLPRPRLDLSGTPGLRPIGLSPGSWQTSLGLGSMSRYSAQILICIIQHYLAVTSLKLIPMPRHLPEMSAQCQTLQIWLQITALTLRWHFADLNCLFSWPRWRHRERSDLCDTKSESKILSTPVFSWRHCYAGC